MAMSTRGQKTFNGRPHDRAHNAGDKRGDDDAGHAKEQRQRARQRLRPQRGLNHAARRKVSSQTFDNASAVDSRGDVHHGLHNGQRKIFRLGEMKVMLRYKGQRVPHGACS